MTDDRGHIHLDRDFEYQVSNFLFLSLVIVTFSVPYS